MHSRGSRTRSGSPFLCLLCSRALMEEEEFQLGLEDDSQRRPSEVVDPLCRESERSVRPVPDQDPPSSCLGSPPPCRYGKTRPPMRTTFRRRVSHDTFRRHAHSYTHAYTSLLSSRRFTLCFSVVRSLVVCVCVRLRLCLLVRYCLTATSLGEIFLVGKNRDQFPAFAMGLQCDSP